MKKKTGTTAFVAANVVVLALFALNNYKPQLTKLSKKYIKVKKYPKQLNTIKKLETKRIISKATKMIGTPEDLIMESLSSDFLELNPNNIIPREVYSYIADKFMNFNSFNILLAKNIAYLYPKRLPAMYTSIEDRYNFSSLEDIRIDGGSAVLRMDGAVPGINPTLPFGKILGSMALIIALNLFGADVLTNSLPNIDFSLEAVEETISDLEEYLTDKTDIILTLNNHDDIVDRKVDRIMNQDIPIEDKFNNIVSLNKLTFDDKVNAILELDNITYTDKFDFFINSDYFQNGDAVKIIANSNIIDATAKFDYIMALPILTIDEKVDYILHSTSTNYEDIFNYILDNKEINNSIGGEKIADSNIVSYDTMFNYFMNRNDTLDSKVWNILLIPNVEFEKVFNDLLACDDIKQDELIESIIKTELVSFNTLFENILSIEDISSKDICDYLVYFNTYFGDSYTGIPLKDIVTYTLNIDVLTYEDKVECFFGLLDNLSIEDKQQFILDYYNIDYIEDYVPLMISDENNLTSDQKMILDLFDRINELKLEYVLSHYGFNNIDEFKAVCAGCAAEGAFDYQDIYWVANILFNRITHPRYSKKGTNPYVQFTSPGQFAVYIKKDYLSYLYPSDYSHEEKNKIATQAVLDMFYLGYNGIEHNYIEFRSWGVTDFSNNYIVEGGNRYKVTLKDENRLIYDDLNGSDTFSQENNNNISLSLTIK